MRSLRSFVSLPFALLVATTVVGCGNDKPKPDPSATAATATESGNPKGRLNLRTPLAPQVKVDPAATKDYRIDVCYFGTMTLRQARDAYLGSLGGAEPSEKKLPSFGGAAAPASPTAPVTAGSGTPAARPPTTPTAKAPAAPATSGKPSAAPAAGTAAPKTSGTPAAGTPNAAGNEPPRRPFDMAIRAPHERNARACSVAAGLKDVPMGDVDAALQAYAPFAVELAKSIATATTYYQREEFKKDSFAKGKELHKQLTEGFAKLDELQDKLGAAIDAWRKAHPPDAAKQDEAEKLAIGAFNDARDALLAVASKKANAAAFKEASGKLEKSLEALKGFATSHPTDPWGKMMVPSLESMLKATKDAGEKVVNDKAIDGDTLLVLTNSFVSVIEARYRALSRATTMKAAPAGSGTPAAPPPAATPTGG